MNQTDDNAGKMSLKQDNHKFSLMAQHSSDYKTPTVLLFLTRGVNSIFDLN